MERSRGESVIAIQESAEPLRPADAPWRRAARWATGRNDVSEPLVMALSLVVGEALVDDVAQMPFAERNDVPRGLVPEREGEPLRGSGRTPSS